MASGMQYDMGEGRVVYLLVQGQAEPADQVIPLGVTSISHVGTVDDQDQQHGRWLRSRRPAQPDDRNAIRGRSGHSPGLGGGDAGGRPRAARQADMSMAGLTSTTGVPSIASSASTSIRSPSRA